MLIVLFSPQSRNIDNEFDFQQLAYFKTRIGVSNSFQVREGVIQGIREQGVLPDQLTAGLTKSAARPSGASRFPCGVTLPCHMSHG